MKGSCCVGVLLPLHGGARGPGGHDGEDVALGLPAALPGEEPGAAARPLRPHRARRLRRARARLPRAFLRHVFVMPVSLHILSNSLHQRLADCRNFACEHLLESSLHVGLALFFQKELCWVF